MDTEAVLGELGEICDVVSETDGSIPERYLVGGRGDRGSALAVVAPRTLEQVRAIVRYCFKKELKILPQGARSGLVGASVPSTSDANNTIVMTLERFKSSPEYRKADGQVIVQAGHTLSEVNEFLKPFGVCVAIDVSSDPMFGGMAATNIAGSRVLRYGDFRSMCEGVQVVLADETASVYDTTNKPIKDNSRFDLTGTFIGSFGALGIITSATLKVYPLITNTSTAWIPVSEGVDLSEVVGEIKRVSGQELLALEFISKQALFALIDSESQKQSKVPVPYAQDDVDVVFVEWGSASPEFQSEEFLEKALGELAESGLIEDAQIVTPSNTWDIRHRISESVQHSGKKLVGCDISVTCDLVNELRNQVKAKLAEGYPDLIVCDFGHLGDGGFHTNIVVPHSVENWSDEKTLEVRTLVSEIAVSLGGSFSAEHGLGSFNTPFQERFTDPVTADLIAGLKEKCDPKGILGHSGVVI